jgi:hypothetical protein
MVPITAVVVSGGVINDFLIQRSFRRWRRIFVQAVHSVETVEQRLQNQSPQAIMKRQQTRAVERLDETSLR